VAGSIIANNYDNASGTDLLFISFRTLHFLEIQ